MNLSWISPKISPSPKYKTSLACLGRRGVDTLQQQGLYLRSLPILLPNIPPLYLSWETSLFLPSWGIKPVLLGTQRSEYSALQRRARPLFALWPLLFAFGCALEYCQIGLALGLDSRYSSLPGFSSHFIPFTFSTFLPLSFSTRFPPFVCCRRCLLRALCSVQTNLLPVKIDVTH